MCVVGSVYEMGAYRVGHVSLCLKCRTVNGFWWNWILENFMRNCLIGQFLFKSDMFNDDFAWRSIWISVFLHVYIHWSEIVGTKTVERKKHILCSAHFLRKSS